MRRGAIQYGAVRCTDRIHGPSDHRRTDGRTDGRTDRARGHSGRPVRCGAAAAHAHAHAETRRNTPKREDRAEIRPRSAARVDHRRVSRERARLVSKSIIPRFFDFRRYRDFLVNIINPGSDYCDQRGLVVILGNERQDCSGAVNGDQRPNYQGETRKRKRR